MIHHYKRSVGLLLACALGSTNVLAQSDSSFLEEIVVLAQKREQNLQDVPVAVTAYTGAMITESGVKDIRELAALAPSLTSSQSQTSTNSSFSIRGVGTSSQNFGLEASVGVYVDGVYRARPSSIINNLSDIDTIEVLRGPQGTLFGKNTPSGALNIRSVKPSHERDAFFEITAGDYDLLNINAATNFSLIDDVLAMRATVFSGKRDGYVNVLGMGSDLINDRDRFGGRIQLYYTPNDKFDLRLIADHSEIDETCCATLTRLNNFMGANGALGSDAFIAGALGLPVITAAQYDEQIMALNSLPRSTNEDSGISIEMNYEFEHFTLTSISALRSFETTDNIDADFSAADIVSDENIADQQAFSQELRLAGEFGESSNYVVGAYYFQQDLDNVSTLGLGVHTNALLTSDPTLAAAIGGINALSAATGGAFPMAATAFPADGFATDDMRQEHKSFALFGQVDLALTEDLVLTAGVRYTDETKDLNYDFRNGPLGPPPDFVAIGTTLGLLQAGLLNPADPADQATIVGALSPTWVPGWGFYTLASLAPQASGSANLDDDQVTGTVKLSWFANDNTMFYASYGTGYKSGGTNTDRINPVFSQTFGPETAESIEVGMKADFPNQNMRLNVALHDTEFEDLQTNAFTGTGFNLQNAGIADTYGAEVEMFWSPTDTFDVQLSYAYNIADLQDFEDGTCWVATPFVTGNPDPGLNANGITCNRSGGRIPSNPEHSGFLALNKEFQVGTATTAFVRGEYTYLGDTMTDGNNDPLKLRPNFSFVNARLGLIFDNSNSELAVWGRNLTDERWYETVFDVPIQDGKQNAYPREPRTWGISYMKRFD